MDHVRWQNVQNESCAEMLHVTTKTIEKTDRRTTAGEKSHRTYCTEWKIKSKEKNKGDRKKKKNKIIGGRKNKKGRTLSS